MDTYGTMFKYRIQVIRAKYSLGYHPDTMVDEYLEAISDLECIGEKRVGYVNLLWMVALGILFEISTDNLKRLAAIVKKENVDDALMDFLLKACDIEWSHCTNHYEKENPYAKTAEIIKVALQGNDKETATKLLENYMVKEWFKGHYDYEWKNAHKEPGYVGFWSFETAALVKLLKLDDSAIKDNNHYPYDLAHYKNEMSFLVTCNSNDLEKEADVEEDIYGIPNNTKLERIIPTRYHKFVNEVINDYEILTEIEFWNKYKLNEIWFDFEEFRKNNKGKNLLGEILIFLLVDKGLVLQLDYKEDLIDYVENIHNHWRKKEVKLISFELNNDQNYYAYIPSDIAIDSLYEVKVKYLS